MNLMLIRSFLRKNDLDFNISLDISKNHYVEKSLKF